MGLPVMPSWSGGIAGGNSEWLENAQRFVSPLGSNSRDGKGWNSAKRTIYDGLESLLDAGGGRLFVGAGSIIGGPVNGQGIRLRSDFQVGAGDFFNAPGYLPMAPLAIVGCGNSNGGNSFATGVVSRFGSDVLNNAYNPYISIVGSLVMPTIVVENMKAWTPNHMIFRLGVDYQYNLNGTLVDVEVSNATRTGTTTVYTIALPATFAATFAERTSNVTTLTIPNPGIPYPPWRAGVPVRVVTGHGSFPAGDYVLGQLTSNPLANNEEWTISYPDVGADVGPTAITGTAQTHGCRDGSLLDLDSNNAEFLGTQYYVNSVTIDTITVTDIYGSGDADEDDIGPIHVQERLYCGTSNVQFRNCSGDIDNFSNPYAAHTFDIGHTQAIRPIIEDCWYGGFVDSGSPIRDERRMSAIYVYPGKTPNVGPACAAITVRDCAGTNGSIYVETDPHGVGVVDIRRTLVESSYLELELPALRVDGNMYTAVIGEDIGNADADIEVPTVVLNSCPPTSIIYRSGFVRGACVGGDMWQVPPAYVASGANWQTPWQRQQVTTWADGRTTGKYPGVARSGAPTVTRFPNLIAAPGSWSLGPTVTIDENEPDPLGGNLGVTMTVPTQAYSQIRPTGTDGNTWEVGGKFSICGWIDARGVNDLLPQELFRVRTTGVTFKESETGGIPTPYTGTGWQPVSGFLTVDSVSDSTPSYSVEVIFQSGAVVGLCGLTAKYLAPGVNDNDAYEVLGTVVPQARGVATGICATLDGVKLAGMGGFAGPAPTIALAASGNGKAVPYYDPATGNLLGYLELKDIFVP